MPDSNPDLNVNNNDQIRQQAPDQNQGNVANQIVPPINPQINNNNQPMQQTISDYLLRHLEDLQHEYGVIGETELNGNGQSVINQLFSEPKMAVNQIIIPMKQAIYQAYIGKAEKNQQLMQYILLQSYDINQKWLINAQMEVAQANTVALFKAYGITLGLYQPKLLAGETIFNEVLFNDSRPQADVVLPAVFGFGYKNKDEIRDEVIIMFAHAAMHRYRYTHIWQEEQSTAFTLLQASTKAFLGRADDFIYTGKLMRFVCHAVSFRRCQWFKIQFENHIPKPILLRFSGVIPGLSDIHSLYAVAESMISSLYLGRYTAITKSLYTILKAARQVTTANPERFCDAARLFGYDKLLISGIKEITELSSPIFEGFVKAILSSTTLQKIKIFGRLNATRQATVQLYQAYFTGQKELMNNKFCQDTHVDGSIQLEYNSIIEKIGQELVISSTGKDVNPALKCVMTDLKKFAYRPEEPGEIVAYDTFWKGISKNIPEIEAYQA